MSLVNPDQTVRLNLVFVLAVVIVAALPALDADDLGVTHLLGVDDAVSIELTMEIESRQGTRERGVEVYLKSDDRVRRVFAQIVDPPFLNRTRFLSLDRGGNRSARYLATSQGVRRLAESNRDERVFGSDFTAGDLSFLNMDQLTVEEVSPASDGSQRFEIRPRDNGPVRTLTVDRESGLAVDVTYSEDGRETRRYRVSEIGYARGRPYPRVATMESTREETSTRITITSFDTESPIPDRLFNRAALE